MKDRSKIIFGAANGAMFAVFMLVFLAIVNEGLTLATIAGAIVAGVLFGVGIAVFMGGRLEQVRTATKALSVDKIREFETLYQNEEMPREKDKQEYLAYLKASRKNSKTLDTFLYIISAIITADVIYSLVQGGSAWDLVTLLIIGLLLAMTLYGRQKYERVVSALKTPKKKSRSS